MVTPAPTPTPVLTLNLTPSPIRLRKNLLDSDSCSGSCTSLLWIRCFTMIISAWWNLANSKLKKSEETLTGKLGNKGNSLESLNSSYA